MNKTSFFTLFTTFVPNYKADRIRSLNKFTWSDVHKVSSIGSSWMEFLDRSTLMTSPDSHTCDGTALKPRPSNESS